MDKNEFVDETQGLCLTMIPIEKRENYRCYYCGTNKSVKYIVKVFDPIINNNTISVPCCNKCVLTHR